MNTRLLIAIVLVLTLGACSSQQVVNQAMSTNVNYGVRLDPKPNPAPGRVNILSKAQGDKKSGKKNGYVGYAQGEQGITVFFIKNEDPADSCGNGANWEITQLRLASQGDPTTEKGSNFGAKQPAWLALAFPGVNLAGGVLFPQTAGQPGVTFLPVFNANQTDKPVDVYYELTLKSCTSPFTTITTDPMWGNGGKK